MISRKRYGQDGSSAVVMLVIAIVFLVLFAGILDVCRIFTGRESTRNAADAISLAVAQEMIFLEHQGLEIIAVQMAGRHGCRLESLNITYDTVTVSVVSEIELLLLDRFRHSGIWIIRSASAAEATYPWDSRLGTCRYYEFNFTDRGN